jgi:F-type H+-transporting ATPase subunit epsilon
MRLKIILPTEIIFDGQVQKISSEATHGAFTILPKHIDFTAALSPGLLFFVNKENQEIFYGIDEGIFVKRGDLVLVSVRKAFHGPDLGSVQDKVQQYYLQLDDKERCARSALAKMQADFVRRFIETR